MALLRRCKQWPGPPKRAEKKTSTAARCKMLKCVLRWSYKLACHSTAPQNGNNVHSPAVFCTQKDAQPQQDPLQVVQKGSPQQQKSGEFDARSTPVGGGPPHPTTKGPKHLLYPSELRLLEKLTAQFTAACVLQPA